VGKILTGQGASLYHKQTLYPISDLRVYFILHFYFDQLPSLLYIYLWYEFLIYLAIAIAPPLKSPSLRQLSWLFYSLRKASSIPKRRWMSYRITRSRCPKTVSLHSDSLGTRTLTIFLISKYRKHFGNWICFRLQMSGGDTYSVGCLRKSWHQLLDNPCHIWS
jgi:hypothetical protein